MGLLGTGENGTGMIFLIIVVVLAVAFIFWARGGELPGAPKLDFNASEVSGYFPYKDNSGNDLNTLFPSFGGSSQSDSKVTAYFCPQDACADHLIQRINSSQKSLYIAIYSFTHDGIADAVIAAKKRGVDVKVIFDYDQSKIKESDDEKLAVAGIPIALRSGSGYMHNKFAVIDGNVVATGSFNYSENADTKNEENLVFIENPSIAGQFKQDFDSIWAAAASAS